jgi:glycosyltransferase involved in cell wall biosynthesis
MARRILLVCTAFAPSMQIGARRCEAMARHFLARGSDVAVVSPEPDLMPPTDSELVAPPGCEVVRAGAFAPRILGRRWLAGSRSAGGAAAPTRGVARALRGVAGRALASLEFPDELEGWIRPAVAALRGRSFDLVLASLPAFSAAIAGRRIAESCGAPLVLDYRDPWTDILERRPVGERRRWIGRHRRAERRCLARASLLVAATPTIARWLARRTARPIEVVVTGFEPAARPWTRPARAPGEPRRIVYAGSLGYGRTLEPLLAAMAAARGGPAARLELDCVGADAPRVAAWAERAGVRGRVRLLGPRGHRETSERTRAADAAVVLVSPDWSYALPGKLFEILREGTPLLLIAPRGCDAEALVRRHGLGWSHPAEDVAGIAESLGELCEGRLPERRDVAALTTASTMARLERALEVVWGHSTA